MNHHQKQQNQISKKNKWKKNKVQVQSKKNATKVTAGAGQGNNAPTRNATTKLVALKVPNLNYKSSRNLRSSGNLRNENQIEKLNIIDQIHEPEPTRIIKHYNNKHSHNHFKEDLERAIQTMDANMHSYANTLLYPEVCMSRIPFICPVPTSLCRGVAIYSFDPSKYLEAQTPPGQGDTFAWAFTPECL